jgi:rhodanese-related sulfurtransferase
VKESKQRIQEISIEEVKQKLEAGENLRLLDVREGEEYARGRLPRAESLCKGILERDIERKVPDPETTVVLYCGGGYRSALAADNLQKMGYKHVFSMAGGWGAWKESGYPVEE